VKSIPLNLLCFLLLISTCKIEDDNSPEEFQPSLFIDSLRNSSLPLESKMKAIRDQGFAYYNNGNFNASETLFDHCYHLDSSDIANQYAWALVCSIKGDYNLAVRLFSGVIQQDSLTYLSAYGSMATIYAFQQRYEEAGKIADNMLKSSHPKINREAYSVASALAIRRGFLKEAVNWIKLRIPLTNKLYGPSSSALEHPYWDYHLIGNIYLTMHLPDSAKKYVDEGQALLTPDDDPDITGYITRDYTYFKSMYLLEKGLVDDAYATFSDEFATNTNGYGGIWAMILIEKNLPDSALTILDTHCREGYYRQFLRGKAYFRAGETALASKFFEEVLNFHQVGEWYWQHEYALIGDEIRELVGN